MPGYCFLLFRKKSGEQIAKRKIALLTKNLKLLSVDEKAVKKALENPKVNDSEDGFQYYAAIEKGCECIVTEDRNDFYFSEIEVLGAEAFLKAHVF